MRALLTYSNASGHGQLRKYHDKIVASLKEQFETLDEKISHTAEEGRQIAKDACGVYDVLIIAGGDGTFHNVINAIAEEKNRPILAYINNGTIGDIGANFGIGKSYKKALKVIKKGKPTPFDIVKVNDGYCAYACAIGSFTDVPWITPRQKKKRMGRVAYYNLAVKEAFTPNKVLAHIVVDNKTITYETPFVLVLNGKNTGGFRVNERGNIFDGKMELFLTPRGLFNGLLYFIFARNKIRKISGTDITIHTDQEMPWCIDGEEGPRGDVHLHVLHNHLQIYSLKFPKSK